MICKTGGGEEEGERERESKVNRDFLLANREIQNQRQALCQSTKQGKDEACKQSEMRVRAGRDRQTDR